MEGLLQQFFASEVPVEYQSDEPLRHTSTIPQEVVELPTSSKESRQIVAYMAVTISTICCLLVVMLRPNQPASTPTISHEAAPASTNSAGEFVPVEERELLLPSSLTDPSVESPEGSGETVVPELEVEIFPLRPDKPE